MQTVTVISEPGVYSLIAKSKLESAERFQDWVYEEVLPSIRKHGMYTTDQLLENPDLLIQVATQLKEERQARLEEHQGRLKAEQTIEEQKPAVDFTEAVMVNDKNISMAELAKLISNEAGFIVGRNRLTQILREGGVLTQKGNRPMQRFVENGMLTYKIYQCEFMAQPTYTMFVTPHGQMHFVNKFKEMINKGLLTE